MHRGFKKIVAASVLMLSLDVAGNEAVTATAPLDAASAGTIPLSGSGEAPPASTPQPAEAAATHKNLWSPPSLQL